MGQFLQKKSGRNVLIFFTILQIYDIIRKDFLNMVVENVKKGAAEMQLFFYCVVIA
jgi:hypothetical protein